MEVKALRYNSQLCHIFFSTSWMRTDEVWYNLLIQIFLLINSVENLLKLLEQLERRLTHKLQHRI